MQPNPDPHNSDLWSRYYALIIPIVVGAIAVLTLDVAGDRLLAPQIEKGVRTTLLIVWGAFLYRGMVLCGALNHLNEPARLYVEALQYRNPGEQI